MLYLSDLKKPPDPLRSFRLVLEARSRGSYSAVMRKLSQIQPVFVRRPRCRFLSVRRLCWLLLCLSVLTFARLTSADEQRSGRPQFRVSFAKSLRAEPFSGRVVLFFS